MRLEKDLVDFIRTWCNKNGWVFIKFSDASTFAIPDIYILKNGRGIWIETKSSNDRRKNALQRWRIKDINNHGGEAYFGVKEKEEFLKIIVDNTHI